MRRLLVLAVALLCAAWSPGTFAPAQYGRYGAPLPGYQAGAFTPSALPGLVGWWEADNGPTVTMTAITAAGTTPPTVTISGTPTLGSATFTPSQLYMAVTTGGALGTSLFKWSTNNGSTFIATGVATAASVALTGTGLIASFGAGTYATNNVYTATGQVSQVADNSGTGNTIGSTAANRPTYFGAAQNGLPGIFFAGAQGLQIGTFRPGASLTAVTIFMVGTVSAMTTTQMVLENSSNGSATPGTYYICVDAFGSDPNNVDFVTSADGTSGHDSQAYFAPSGFSSAWQFDDVKSIGSSGGLQDVVRYNRGAVALTTRQNSAGTGTFSNSQNLNFFARSNGASLPTTGYMFEALYYNRALAAGEIQLVENYLSAKWGTP